MRNPDPKRQSLVFKLTASYLLAAGAVLLSSSLALYWTLAHNLDRFELRLLDQKIDLFIADQAAEPGDYAELFKQLSLKSSNHHPEEYWVRFLDGSGKTLAETPDMGALLPAAAFPDTSLSGAGRSVKRLSLAHGRAFRLRSAWSTAKGQQRSEIQIALDCRHDEALLQEYRGRLALVVLLGLALLAGLSVIIARKGLQPLDDLGRVIRSQTTESLNVAIDPSQWPLETHKVIEGYNDLSQRLHESFQRLSQFSADLAHELRTPLHNLRLQSEVILARPRKAHDYKLALENAQEEYERLSRMTESLLFLARAENGKQPLSLVKLRARKEFSDAARQFEALAAEKGIRLTLRGQATVMADKGLLQLVLGNLLANAFAHTPKGGRIILCAGCTDAGAPRISVADDGEGIGAEHLPLVFNRFFRGDPARAKTGGSGLGLAIVQAVMILHRGLVSIKSEKNKGTTVTLEFPRAPLSPVGS
jgi:two-component system heavy metal sensor histidine kinase CusS